MTFSFSLSLGLSGASSDDESGRPSASEEDLTKEKITEYEKHCKNQLKQGQKIVIQRNALEEKISKKDRVLMETKAELKNEKESTQRKERENRSELKRLERQHTSELKEENVRFQQLERKYKYNQLEKSNEKEKENTERLDGKLKKVEESRDTLKKKVEQLTGELREVKGSTGSKPSSEQQLFMDKNKLKLT